ncbi:pyruvate, phosphate dikinase [Nocardioides sp. AE5]|uniref:pyruvate, phosphate dikinase n=1 Tax=Nocardioides sp. AE5 TaxID=2962573 RepID=UPI0028824614|nr:pyruvate, phosphate dikinase [Nocardioides sp. AE5]MDT0201659.1 pyruvate, phosphate dikinase [Nocardioides sp. AE5]
MTSSQSTVVLLDGSHDGDRELLGGKAYSVNRMRSLGLPVPPAFALPTTVCGTYHGNDRALPEAVWDEVVAAVRALEADTGRTFGTGPSPLLVSVRSGAAQSMPGMMDTVLNLGLTPELVDVLGAESGDTDWAQDTWQRFQRSYAEIVLGGEGATPADPWEQLRAAIGAVFDSWTNERVRTYRERHGLGEGGGTAVTVQAMVFGNRDEASGTGVMFSRNPSSGVPELYGEWLAHAQGEDVVSGEKTPTQLAELATSDPGLHAELARVAGVLEAEYRDLVDIEFTVESGRLFMLQSRAGKRSPQAAVRIAVDLVEAGTITPAEALGRITADHVESLAGSTQVDAGDHEVLATGLGACPGVATGHVARDLEEVLTLVDEGKPVILVRTFTAPDDVPAMFQAAGVLTEVGGATSHAALVCREIGLPCVVGAGPGLVEALAGQVITIDGTSGKVHAEGSVNTSSVAADPHVQKLIEYAGTDAGHPIHRLATIDA